MSHQRPVAFGSPHAGAQWLVTSSHDETASIPNGYTTRNYRRTHQNKCCRKREPSIEPITPVVALSLLMLELTLHYLPLHRNRYVHQVLDDVFQALMSPYSFEGLVFL